VRRILGVDPGGTTGLCVLQWEGELPARADTSAMAWAAQKDPETAEDVIYAAIAESEFGQLTHVAIERFSIGPGTHKLTRSYDALYIIGLVRALCRWHDVELRLQQPASAKKAYTDDRLKELGYWFAGDHARDAIRHALLCTHT